MAETERGDLVDRTLANLRAAWRDLTIGTRAGSPGNVRPELPKEDISVVRGQIMACLEGRGGEVSARARAADLGRLYLSLDDVGRGRFLALLASEFGTDRAELERAVGVLNEAADDDARALAERGLRQALIPARVRLLTQFNGLPDGIKFLIDMRAELRERMDDDPSLHVLDDDLRDLLGAWFDIGLLSLRQITWETASAALLEKLAAYEAVHAIRSWQDLKHRMRADRRFFAFFHPNMPDEPLIFVEVALVNGMADNVKTLLDARRREKDPQAADSAIFYSISNAQKGLVGLSFGGFLIKRVLDDLRRELPGLKVFATLSPIPCFRKWLSRSIAANDESLLGAAEGRAIAGFVGEDAANAALGKLLDGPWHRDEKAREIVQQPLMRLAARYLLDERRNGEPIDRVARFHLSNGARVERLNWMADPSRSGLARSAGIMVNYEYRPNEIEENHEAYKGEEKIVASSSVRALLGTRRARRARSTQARSA